MNVKSQQTAHASAGLMRPAASRNTYDQRRFAGRLGLLGVLVLAWWIVSMSSDLVASPSTTVATLWQGFADGWIDAPLLDSGKAIIVGFVLAALIGVPLGILFGYCRFLGAVVDPFLAMLFAVPRVILYPVILAAVGVGFEAKIWMAVLSAVLPILMNTIAGVRATSDTLLKLGRSMGCGTGGLLHHICLPSAAPAIMVGLRIGLSISFISVIVAELFAATQGLGLVIQSAYGLQQYPRMFAVVLLVTVLALVVNLGLLWLERKVGKSLS